MKTEHKLKIANVNSEKSGVYIINLPFSINDRTIIEVKNDDSIKAIAKMSSHKTIKLIWFTDDIKPVYNVNLTIQR